MPEQMQLPFKTRTVEPLWQTLGLEDPIGFENKVMRAYVKKLRETTNAWEMRATITDLMELRQTGKTTRILLQAIEEAWAGRKVVIMVRDHLCYDFMERRLTDHIDTLSTIILDGFSSWLKLYRNISIRVCPIGEELLGIPREALLLDDRY